MYSIYYVLSAPDTSNTRAVYFFQTLVVPPYSLSFP